jgi:uncharacterized protein
MLHTSTAKNTPPISSENKAAVFLKTASGSSLRKMKNSDTKEILDFLAVRPVHTVVMTSWINDNGVENPANRGKFYGYYNETGKLEGIALIGHTTLVEARSDEALKSFAVESRNTETPIHIIMSAGKVVEDFWNFHTGTTKAPRLLYTELLFELSFPFLVREEFKGLRLATKDELMLVAEAHAEVAFEESGKNPLETHREQFISRVLRRIEQGRCWVVIEDGKLLFKADVVAETNEISYLEGIYVPSQNRGKGFGTKCLTELGKRLLEKTDTVCLLSNIKFTHAHKAYLKAGFKMTDACQTIFV